MDQYGNIVVFCNKGNVFGHIVIKNREYDFQVFDQWNIFIEYDVEYMSNTLSIFELPPEIPQDILTIENPKTPCTGAVKVLILYTTAAQNAVSSISNTAYMALNSVNDAFNNSGIAWGDLHLSLAAFSWVDFTETDDASDDLLDFATNTTVNNLRNQFEADLVFLLTDGDYGATRGITYLGPNNAWAYSIVEATHAMSGFTFAHETGHLFGCLHEDGANNGLTGTYEYPHKFTTGWWLWEEKYRTIMYTNAIANLEYTRIQHFSNPDIEYDNGATGSATHDNAKKLEEESCTVETFRISTPPMTVYITGPTHGNNSGTYTWTAQAANAQQPISYLWKYSLDGTNYNGSLGTGQSVTAPLPIDNDLYLKVIATDNNQQQAINYFVTINDDAHGGAIIHKSTEDLSDTTSQDRNLNISAISNQQKEKKLNIMTLFPNPATDNTTIRYSIPQKGLVQISIINSLGEVVQMHELDHSSGIFCRTLYTSNLDKGIYFVKTTFKENQDIHQLIIK